MRRYRLHLQPGEVHGLNPKPECFRAKNHTAAWQVVQKILRIAGRVTRASFHAHGGKSLRCRSSKDKDEEVPVPQ